MKISKSKRLWFSIAALVANILLVLIGIFNGADLTALGTCLALINTPLYSYIFGESFRPSKQENDTN